jgi:hypothetical protein
MTTLDEYKVIDESVLSEVKHSDGKIVKRYKEKTEILFSNGVKRE